MHRNDNEAGGNTLRFASPKHRLQPSCHSEALEEIKTLVRLKLGWQLWYFHGSTNALEPHHISSLLCFCLISKSQNKAVAPSYRTTSSVQKDCKSDVKFLVSFPGSTVTFLQLEGGMFCVSLRSRCSMSSLNLALGKQRSKCGHVLTPSKWSSEGARVLEWMSQWCVPSGLHSGLFLKVNFWQLLPFEKSSVALFCLHLSWKCCRRLPQSCDSWGVAGILIIPMH